MTNIFFGGRSNTLDISEAPGPKRLTFPSRNRDTMRAFSVTTAAEEDLDLFSKSQPGFLGRFLKSRVRPSRSLDDHSSANSFATTSVSNNAPGQPPADSHMRLSVRRPALRITRDARGNIRSQIRDFFKRLAALICTVALFTSCMTIFFTSVKTVYTFPRNVTQGNATFIKPDYTVDPPALVVYILSSCLVLFLPVAFIASLCIERRPATFTSLFTGYVIELTEGYATWGALIIRSVWVSALWTLFFYCYVRSLRDLSVSDMAAFLCILPPYSYLFSWILVPKKFVAFRIIALILVSCGMIFLTYFDPKFIGSKVIAICGIVLMGLFTTIRRNLIGELTLSRVAAFYGFQGLTHAVLSWPLFVILSVLTAYEPISWRHFPVLQVVCVVSGAFGSIIFHEVALLVNGSSLFRLHILAVFPVALCHESFQKGGIVYFDRVRIASSVLMIGGGLITALPTRFYENIEDWIQRRRSPLGVYRAYSTNPNALASAQTGPGAHNTTVGGASGTQAGKGTGTLAATLVIPTGNEAPSGRRPTLALPMRKRSLLRSNSITGNRGH